jgi:hypothetical protein
MRQKARVTQTYTKKTDPLPSILRYRFYVEMYYLPFRTHSCNFDLTNLYVRHVLNPVIDCRKCNKCKVHSSLRSTFDAAEHFQDIWHDRCVIGAHSSLELLRFPAVNNNDVSDVLAFKRGAIRNAGPRKYVR